MSGIWTASVFAGALGFLVVTLLVAWRLRSFTAEEMLMRIDGAGLPSWQVRMLLAGVGWGVAAVAMSVGVALVVCSSWIGSRALAVIAVFVLFSWAIMSVMSTVASTIGRPRVLLLPQFRDREWLLLTARLKETR